MKLECNYYSWNCGSQELYTGICYKTINTEGDQLSRIFWVGLIQIYSAQRSLELFFSTPNLSKTCLASLSLYFVEFICKFEFSAPNCKGTLLFLDIFLFQFLKGKNFLLLGIGIVPKLLKNILKKTVTQNMYI